MSETKQAPTLGSLLAQRDQILALASRYGAYNVRVFGSVARGEATPQSDIDLLVSVREGTSLFELSALWQALQDLLNCRVSLISDGIDDPRFLRQIQADAIPL